MFADNICIAQTTISIDIKLTKVYVYKIIK